MPVLKNSRHEKFAQLLAEGKSATDAYAEAGYSGDRTAASRLSTNANIRQRVDEIKNRVAEKAEWSAADRLIALKSIYDKVEPNDPRVAISAIAEANKMQGSYAPSKLQHTGANGGPVQIADITRLKGMTAEELKILERALVQIGLAEGDQSGTGEPED